MVELFKELIVNKKKTIEQVPVSLQQEVKQCLKDAGYDIEGNLIEGGQ